MRPSDEASAPPTADTASAGLPAPAGGEGPRRSRLLSRWQGVTLSVLAGALLFGACQGDNLFNGNSESVQPKIVGISIPSQVYPGDTIQVQVSAYGPRQITRLQVSLAGAASADTVITLDAPNASVAQNVKLALPYFLRDTALVIRALAYDKAGAASRMRADTARAEAVPVVVSIQGPDSIRGGQTASFLVAAAGFNRISTLRFSFKGLNRGDTAVALPRPDTLVTAQLDLPIGAAALSDTVVTVLVSAVDNRNTSSGWYGVKMPVVISIPTIDSVTVADTVRAGSALDVSVKAHGLRKVNRLSFSLRRAIVRDSVVNLTLPGTSISQSASFAVPGDVQDSVITLSVSALDAAGGVSAPVSKRVAIPVGIPVIDTLMTPDSIRPGTILDARVIAHGSRPLARIDLSLRGAINQDVSVNPTPLRTNVTQDFSVPLPDSVKDSLLVVMTKATDTGGNVSVIKQRTIRTSDTAPPSVVATLMQSTVAAGARAPIRIQAADNVGLARVGVRIYDANKLLVAGDSASASGRSRDSTFSVLIPPSGPRTLMVYGFAIDRNNNEARTVALNLAVVDSTAPVVAIISPPDSQTVSLTAPLLVQVRVQPAMVGIKSITLSGVAIRSSSTSNTTVVQRYTPQSVTYPQAPSTRMPDTTFTLSRYLTPLPDSTSERVSIVAVVADSLGNVAVDTAYVTMGGPLLRLNNPANGLRVGPSASIPVSLHVEDTTNGIDTLVVTVTGGGTPASTLYAFNARKTPIDTAFTVAGPAPGPATLIFKARTRNHLGMQASVTDTVFVMSTAAPDSWAPRVRIVAVDSGTAALSGRLEWNDSIGIRIAVADSGTAGVRRMGITVQADTGGTAGPIAATQLAINISPALTVPPQHTFYFTPSMLPQLSPDSARLPKLVNFRVTAFAVDTMKNCGAGVDLGRDNALTCTTFNVPASSAVDTVAQGGSGYLTQLMLVSGRTTVLQPLSKVADIAPDTVRGRVYIANMGLNQVEQLLASNNTLATPIRAGSQPWGLDLVRDTMLVVANSGGTNISRVSLAGSPNEDPTRRLLTPNVTLWQYTRSKDQATGLYKWTITGPIDFSDRPQFIAQDSLDRILYSTVPTGSAGLGTLRAAEKQSGWKNTETWLLNRAYGWDPDTATFAVENADSVYLYASGNMAIVYHTPGDSTSLHNTGSMDPNVLCAQSPVAGSLAELRKNAQAVAYCAPGRWNLNKIGLSDTTFVAMARDRSHIAFGEGATGGTGRIFMWNSLNQTISPDVQVGDLVNNASERVVGLGLNMQGSLGVARGGLAAYFFDPNLRLQGEFNDIVSGTGGAAMHPHHADAYASNDSTLAFVGSQDAGRPVIKIVDTFSFRQRGEIFIHDNVVGLLKSSMPMNGEAGSCKVAPTNPNCIVLKLYGVTPSWTDANGQPHARVVVVDVRKSDIMP